MPKKIIEMVREKKARMLENPAEAEANAKLAVAAINDGIRSRAWETYMSQFVEDVTTPLGKDQLARLLAEDGTLGQAELDRKRAYLLSNGMCGAASPGNTVATGTGGGGLAFDFLVNTIDQALTDDCPPEPNA